MIDKARWHFTKAEHLQHLDPTGWRKLQEVDMRVGRGIAARKIGDWKNAVREADAAIAAGVDSAPLVTISSWSMFFLLIENVSVFLLLVVAFILTLYLQLLALRSEALLQLHKLEEADSTLTSLLKLECALSSLMSEKFIGMPTKSYVHIIRAQVDMALGRYE
jgi:hypothetical protein